MTIQERLCFIRAGYSAQDIAGFEAAEAAADPAPAPAADPAPVDDMPVWAAADPAPAPAPADPAPAPAPVDDMPVWAAALAKSIQDMTKAMQANNARFDDMGDPVSVQQQADDALAAYVRGGKSNNGGKNK